MVESHLIQRPSKPLMEESYPAISRKASSSPSQHSIGKAQHGTLVQALRLLAFLNWTMCVCVVIHITQLLGSPLYFYNQDLYYAYMALTKKSFGLFITTITQWFSPTLIRVSGEASVRRQMMVSKDGRLETHFPERLVLISNHQLYSDWLYLWWIAYTNRMHGHIYIILKESLKYIPILGPGMMFYGFVFMARRWDKDQARLKHRLQKLNSRHSGLSSGSPTLDPMWLILYPEGTNLSPNARQSSSKWAAKQGISDLEYQLLPRSTGMLYCLQELKGTVEWVYDCTTAYEGIPRGEYGQDLFTLKTSFLQARPPKSVNMHWRRFAISSIPLDDPKRFEQWLMERWVEKERLLEYYAHHSRFPVDLDPNVDKNANDTGYIETEVKLATYLEVGQIFVVLATWALTANILTKVWDLVVHGTLGF